MKAADVAGRMRAVEVATARAGREAVVAAAAKTKAVIAAGAPARLRGAGRLGIRSTLAGSGANPSATLQATGPWQLIEEDTSAHVIRPKRLRATTGRGRAGAIIVPGIGPRAVVHHPGTKGQHPWAKGVEKARPVAAADMRKRVTNGATEAFGG